MPAAIKTAVQNLAVEPVDRESQSRNEKISAANTKRNNKSIRAVKVSQFKTLIP